MGPFSVVALVGPVAVHLALTGKLRGLHPVFHVSLLHRYKPGGDGVEPPPPIVVDEDCKGFSGCVAHCTAYNIALHSTAPMCTATQCHNRYNIYT